MLPTRRSPASVSPRPRASARRRAVSALATFALLAAGCVSDPAAPAAAGDARLALTARVGVATADAVGVTMRYLRNDGSAPLLDLTIPITDPTPGATLTRPIAVELGACLADPAHLPGGDRCTVLTTVRLLEGGALLDEISLPPMELRAGQTATPAPVYLSEVRELALYVSGETTLAPGDILSVMAQLLDRDSQPVTGRAIAWASLAPAVATVDATTGTITAVAPGTAIIRASSGQHQADLFITVAPRAQIELSAGTAAFTAGHQAALPAAQNIIVTSAGGTTLSGLAVEAVRYDGAQTDWLSVVLSSPTAPTTLVLRPTRTDLPAGTHTAAITLSAPGATPRTVDVSFQVTATVLLVADATRLTFESHNEAPAPQVLTVTAGPDITGPVSATIEYRNPTRDWLVLEVEKAGPTETVLSVQPGHLPVAGVYEADIVLTAPGATHPTRVRVRYEATVDYSEYYFFLDYSHYFVEFGDSLYITPVLYNNEEQQVNGVPVTFSVDIPGVVDLRPASTVTGQSVWVVPTGQASGTIVIAAMIDGNADSVYIDVYDGEGGNGNEGGEPQPRRARPRTPGAPAARVQAPRTPQSRVPHTPAPATAPRTSPPASEQP